MKVSDAELRRHLRESEPARGREGCLSSGVLADAAAGTLSRAEAAAAADHLAACSACAEEYRLIAPLREWAEDAAARIEGRPPRGRRRAVSPRLRPVVWLGAAAAAFLAVAILFPARTTAPPPLRTETAAAIRSLVEGQPLSREACRLRWSDAGAGARYSVTLALKDLTVLYSAGGVDGTEVTVPADVLRPIPPGTEVVWTVEATLPDRRRIASPAFLARLE
jgi:hypothetical protein